MHLSQCVPCTAFIWTFNFKISIPFQAHWSKFQFKSNSLARAALGRFIIIFLLVFAQVKFKVIINLYVLVLYWDLPNFRRNEPALQDCETRFCVGFCGIFEVVIASTKAAFMCCTSSFLCEKQMQHCFLRQPLSQLQGFSYVSRLRRSSPLWLKPFHFTKFLLRFLRRAIALPCLLLTRNALPYIMQYGFSLDKCKKPLCAIMRLWEFFSTNLPLKAYYTSTVREKNSYIPFSKYVG